MLARGWVVAAGAPYRLAGSDPGGARHDRHAAARGGRAPGRRARRDARGRIAAQRVGGRTRQMPARDPDAISPARRCAYAVITRVFAQGAYADAALQAEAAGLDARDRALAMRLAYGTIQRAATLDHVIERLAERPAGRLDRAAARGAAAGAVRAALPAGTARVRDRRRGGRARQAATPAPATAWSTPSCAAPPARVRDEPARRARRRDPRAGRGEALPPGSGSRACGGARSGPSRRAR